MKAIDQLLQDAVERGDARGVTAVAVDARGTRYLGAAGCSDAAANAPMRTDTILRIASMTKAITSLAAMQLVERGALDLHAPISEVLATFSDARVLQGFDEHGKPVLRAPRRAVTLRHLLTHTSGLAYPTWNESLLRFRQCEPEARVLDGPDLRTSLPLVFDPDDRWEYGTNTDWVGVVIEQISGQRLGDFLHDNIFAPLAMNDTAFAPRDESRLATVWRRNADESLHAIDESSLPRAPWDAGGGGLFSTAHDYGKFLRAMLGAGETAPVNAQTLSLMKQNHIGDLVAGTLTSYERDRSNDVSVFPGTKPTWSLFGLINPQPVTGGRSAGSVCWAGLFNSYFWVDSTQQTAAAIFTQTLPFYDARIVALCERFERCVYAR